MSRIWDPGAEGRAAFTLVELLVVMAIIAVLATLVLTSIGWIRTSARITVTSHRMNRIIDGLGTYAIDRGNPALAIQEAARLGGALRFASLNSVINIARQRSQPAPPSNTTQTGTLLEVLSRSTYGGNLHDYNSYFANAQQRMVETVPPADAVSFDYRAYWPAQWPETDWMLPTPGAAPPVLRFPWGRPGITRLLGLTDPSQPESATVGRYAGSVVDNRWITRGSSPASPRTLRWVGDPVRTATINAGSVVAIRSDGREEPCSGAAPMPFDAGWMSPRRSLELIQTSGIIGPSASDLLEVRVDRGVNRDWNDRWGNPLIVVFALFQPERVYSTDAAEYTDRSRDALLKAAESLYGYNRSLYVSVAAPGTSFATATGAWAAAADATVLRDAWIETRVRVQAWEINEKNLASQAGNGLRVVRDGEETALMTIPKEIR